MNRMPSKLALIIACATLVLAACSGGAPQASNDHVLRIAMGSHCLRPHTTPLKPKLSVVM